MLGRVLNASQKKKKKRKTQKLVFTPITAEKMEYSVKDFFSKLEQIRRKLRICSYLLKKSFF